MEPHIKRVWYTPCLSNYYVIYTRINDMCYRFVVFPYEGLNWRLWKNMISVLNIKSSIYDSYLDKFLQILILMNVWECHRRWTGIGLEIRVGPLLTKTTSPNGNRNSHYKPKTVWRPSQVYNGNAYTNNTMSSSSIEAQCREARGRCLKQSYHISMTISNFTKTWFDFNPSMGKWLLAE